MKNRSSKICRRADRNLAYVTLRGRDVYLGTYGSPESYVERERVAAEYWIGSVVEVGSERLLGEFVPLSSLALAMITSKTGGGKETRRRGEKRRKRGDAARAFKRRRAIGALGEKGKKKRRNVPTGNAPPRNVGR